MAKETKPSDKVGMFSHMADSIGSTFESVGNITGLVADGTDTVRELIQPIRIEARADTLTTAISEIKALEEQGVPKETAENYIFYGRM